MFIIKVIQRSNNIKFNTSQYIYSQRFIKPTGSFLDHSPLSECFIVILHFHNLYYKMFKSKCFDFIINYMLSILLYVILKSLVSIENI